MSVATEPSAASSPKPASEGNRVVGLLLHWGPTLVFNILGPLFLYGYLTGHGHEMSKAHALMITSLLPIVEIAAIYALRRRVDDFGVFTLITLALTLISFLAFNSAKAILYKDSAITGVLGLGILATLTFGKPYAYYMGRKFATDGSEPSRAWWAGLWQYPNFRHTNRVITVVWGVMFIVEATVRVVLINLLSVKTMVGLSNVLFYVFLGATVFFTITYSKRRAAEAQRRYGDAATAPGSPTVA